jgi:anthraniloyl-CoA monooxygenase
MKIAVVGGGPGGLLFAELVRRENPGYQVRVLEQNPADATYGFGIVLADVALRVLEGVAPDLHRELVAVAEAQHEIQITHQGVKVPIKGNTFLGIPRVKLLNLMQKRAERLGVEIAYSHRVERVEDLAGYDLIVGADGVNSAIREQLQASFQADKEQRLNKWAWYGTRHRFDCVELIFQDTPHGIFIAHSYRYSPEFGTFVIECHPDVWRRAGLDRMSDEESRVFCADVFRDALGGEALISNRSAWFNPSFVTSRNWSSGNVVLIGDALKTVHPSIGSGTRMAYEDAIALAQAVNAKGPDVPASVAEFEAIRRSRAEGFQDAAMRSIIWYETVDTIKHLSPLEFAFSYMTRTGKVSYERLRRIDPDFLAAYEAEMQARGIEPGAAAQAAAQ